jgi:FKBP-type peptidyl-prolyl cis-trans isomerase FkpA
MFLSFTPNPSRRSRWAGPAVAVIALGLAGSAIGQTATPAGSQSVQPLTSKVGAKVTELQKIDIKPGDGPEAVAGKGVIVHYTGWLYDPAVADGRGAKFDSSFDRNVPFGFVLGRGRVIKGWDEGVAGMKVGGKRTLVIPPDMAYGSRGAGGVIPPEATLLFEVELLEVKS